jgi:hypothetical protein
LRVQGARFRVQGSGFRGSEFRGSGFRFRLQGLSGVGMLLSSVGMLVGVRGSGFGWIRIYLVGEARLGLPDAEHWPLSIHLVKGQY